jgi:serine/threonine protein kinase
MIGDPVFPKTMAEMKIVGMLVRGDWQPVIPDSLYPATAELISECLAIDPKDRPTFSAIFERLIEMEFHLMSGVNSGKVIEFVEQTEKQAGEIAYESGRLNSSCQDRRK